MESFANRPYWRPSYAVTVEILLEQIPFLFDRVKRFLKDPENDDFVAGFVNIYRSHYITECNRGENTGTQTFEETEIALTTSLEHRDYQKTRNLSSAISHIFQDSLVVERPPHFGEKSKWINRHRVVLQCRLLQKNRRETVRI
jgi:hypothetical protein